MFFFELVLMLVAPVAVWLWLDAYIRRQDQERKDRDRRPER